MSFNVLFEQNLARSPRVGPLNFTRKSCGGILPRPKTSVNLRKLRPSAEQADRGRCPTFAAWLHLPSSALSPLQGWFIGRLAATMALLRWGPRPWCKSSRPSHRLPSWPLVLSQGKDRDYLSDAIAEGIITQLSLFPELFVIARNSSFHYRDKNMDVRDVARELGVRYILEGSEQKSAGRLRVTVQLIDAVGGNHVWSRTFNRDLSDILVVQDEISTSIASSLGEKLSKIAGEEAKKANPEELRAYQNVLKANRYLCELTKEDTNKATQAYQAALASDPNLASAHDGMAWIYINGYRFGWTDLDRKAALVKAREEAAIGLQLAPDDYGSHFAMAATLMQAGKRGRAIMEFEKSLELNPNAGDVMATFAEQLGYAGRFEEAVTWLKKAMRLDPHHPIGSTGIWGGPNIPWVNAPRRLRPCDRCRTRRHTRTARWPRYTSSSGGKPRPEKLLAPCWRSNRTIRCASSN